MCIGSVFYILLVFIIKWVHVYCKNVFKIQNYTKQKITTHPLKILFCVLHICVCLHVYIITYIDTCNFLTNRMYSVLQLFLFCLLIYLDTLDLCHLRPYRHRVLFKIQKPFLGLQQDLLTFHSVCFKLYVYSEACKCRDL